MNEEFYEVLTGEVADGSLRKGFLFVSRSKFWTPWMVGGVRDRIEIGLFYDWTSQPGAPAFAVEWTDSHEGTTVEVRSPAGAWRTLPMLDGLVSIFDKIGQTITFDPLSPDDVIKLLESAGFAESRWDISDPDELPLPPPEPLVADRLMALPGYEESKWLGPHVGRTNRFLGLIERFITELRSEDVPAIDGKAGYVGSAFNRLFELWVSDSVTDEMLAASERTEAWDVPYAITDTLAYLKAAITEANQAMRRSGVPETTSYMTLVEPLSQLVFQIWQAEDRDDERLRIAFERAAERCSLVVYWDTERPTVRLPDSILYGGIIVP
jgi:hypothetical protein